MSRQTKPYSATLVSSYFRFYDKILARPGVRLPDAIIFSLLASIQRGQSCSAPSQSYISQRLNISIRSVIRSLQNLAKLGFISIHRISTDDGKAHNSYIVNPQLVESLKDSRYSQRQTQLKHIRSTVSRQSEPRVTKPS